MVKSPGQVVPIRTFSHRFVSSSGGPFPATPQSSFPEGIPPALVSTAGSHMYMLQKSCLPLCFNHSGYGAFTALCSCVPMSSINTTMGTKYRARLDRQTDVDVGGNAQLKVIQYFQTLVD